MIPSWLHLLSIVALAIGLASAAIIAADEMRHPQQMWIMNIVWPVVALFGTVISLWGYYRYGRLGAKQAHEAAGQSPREGRAAGRAPFPITVAKSTSHCGAGCTLGDIVAEWLAFFVPAIAIALGWRSIFQEKMFAVWILDYALAFVLGIAFQYWTIKPMRDLSPGEGIWAALKADALSLTAWQVGMYGFMAFAQFYLFRTLLGTPLLVNSAEFWFMMQIAMLCGFLTSYPVNWWLVKAGIKERM